MKAILILYGVFVCLFSLCVCGKKWFVDWFSLMETCSLWINKFLLFFSSSLTDIIKNWYSLWHSLRILFFSPFCVFINYTFCKWNKIELQWNCRHFSCFFSFIFLHWNVCESFTHNTYRRSYSYQRL